MLANTGQSCLLYERNNSCKVLFLFDAIRALPWLLLCKGDHILLQIPSHPRANESHKELHLCTRLLRYFTVILKEYDDLNM